MSLILPTTFWAQTKSSSAELASQSARVVLDDAGRRTAVDRLARALDSVYVVPQRGEELARLVRARLAAHAYDTIVDPRAFADALSHDLESVAHDLHLWVRYFPAPPPGPAEPDLDETWLNHGYPGVRILDGNIGYIDIRNFTQGADGVRASNAAFTLLADCDALIVDLRNNGGGTTPMMTRIASFFFADSVHLSDLHWRGQDTVHMWTHPPDGARALRQPAFVLTSRRTFSAAENFVYSLQLLHRATVVGEVTRGGAHTARGGLQDLGFGLKALVPSGENLHPTLGTSWEVVGVKPDVPTPDTAAFRVAYRMALDQLLTGAPAGSRRTRLERAIQRSLNVDDPRSR